MVNTYVLSVYDEQLDDASMAWVGEARSLVERARARLLVQACESDAFQWAASDWAGECARRAKRLGAPISGLEMIPGDELNRVSVDDSQVWTPSRGPRWLLDVARRYRRLRRDERLHVPAPRPGDDGAEAIAYWDACARAGLGSRFDAVDVQIVSDEQVRTLPRRAYEMLGLPITVTEWALVDPELVAAEARANPWLEVAIPIAKGDAL